MTVARLGRRSDTLAATVREFALPAAIIAAFALLGVVSEALLGYPRMLPHIIWPPVLAYHAFTAGSFLALVLLYWRWEHRDADGNWVAGVEGWRLALAEYRRERDLDARIARVAVASFLTAIGATVFDSWKIAIPRLRPFTWDPLLSRWDSWLHGRPPWQYLEGLLRIPDGVWVAERFYLSFIPMLAVMALWHAWSADERNRRRFFFCFTAVWFVTGLILAALFSSAGPVFYHLVTGQPGPYGPLLAQLQEAGRSVDLVTPRIQANLWRIYSAGEAPAIAGISAMPSLHIGVPVLYALAARRWWSRVGLWLYAIGIWIATIALGWHYAIDGYVAAAASLALWLVSARLVRPRATHGAPAGAEIASGAAVPENPMLEPIP